MVTVVLSDDVARLVLSSVTGAQAYALAQCTAMTHQANGATDADVAREALDQADWQTGHAELLGEASSILAAAIGEQAAPRDTIAVA